MADSVLERWNTDKTLRLPRHHGPRAVQQRGLRQTSAYKDDPEISCAAVRQRLTMELVRHLHGDLMEIRIGTSGWHYKHWRGPFYEDRCPAGRMLEFYLRHFDTVEINNSFYKLPARETFACWRDATPRGFCFAVKASRFITHNKKLKDPDNALENFLPRADVLRDKLGPILFQLPPLWRVNVGRLEEFLGALPRGKRRHYAFEFRNPTWLVPEVYGVLRQHNAAFCIYELAGFETPKQITADWTYIRLHGPGQKYQGSYSTEQLGGWAERIHQWASELSSVYVYFDNDQAGYAAQNALELKRLVSRRVKDESAQSKTAA